MERGKIVSMRFLALVFVPVLSLAQVCDTAPGRKRAFVIGNGEYRNLPRVATAGQDFEAMKKALEQVGFDVTAVENATMPELYNQQQVGFLSKVHEETTSCFSTIRDMSSRLMVWTTGSYP